MCKVSVILAIAAFCGSAISAKLPSFVTPCRRNDPDLVQCSTNEGRKILPKILDGVPSLKFPNMKPFKLPEANIDVGQSLKIKLTDIEIFGLEENDLQRFEIDINKRHVGAKISFSKLNIRSQYEINGRILVLPISGVGPANITFVDCDIDFQADADIFKKNGNEYIKLNKPRMTYTSKREYYILENLFNGDERLGNHMNKFLDENWQEVSKEIGPAIVEVVKAVVSIIANGFFNRISLDSLLPK